MSIDPDGNAVAVEHVQVTATTATVGGSHHGHGQTTAGDSDDWRDVLGPFSDVDASEEEMGGNVDSPPMKWHTDELDYNYEVKENHDVDPTHTRLETYERRVYHQSSGCELV